MKGSWKLLLLGTAIMAITAFPLRFDAKGMPHMSSAVAEDGGGGDGHGGGGGGGHGGDGGGDGGSDGSHDGSAMNGGHDGTDDSAAHDLNDDHRGLAKADDDPATHDIADDNDNAPAGTNQLPPSNP